jgi:hypothetical protein
VEVVVPEEQLVKDMVGDWQLEAVLDTLAEGLTDAQVEGDELKDPELQCVLVTVMLCEKELTSEDVGNGVKVTDTVGLIDTLVVTVGEGELVKQSVGEPVWVEDVLTVTVPQSVPDTLLHSDTVALEHWLKLRVEVIDAEGQLEKVIVED